MVLRSSHYIIVYIKIIIVRLNVRGIHWKNVMDYSCSNTENISNIFISEYYSKICEGITDIDICYLID